MTDTQRIERIADLRQQVAAWRSAGQRIALVPTMGCLHDGHLSLIELARQQADRVVVSIFVNPTQFGPGEDYERYPRSLEADCAFVQGKVDAMFVPSVPEVYPLGGGVVRVEVPGISEILCGQQRPGHFTGVATIVAVLYNLVQPDLAVFGEKDFQQLAVVRRMTTAMGFPVEVLGARTLREADGLAMSSRNQYLSERQRQRQAPMLYNSLQSAADTLAAGGRDFGKLEMAGEAYLARAGFAVDYFAIRKPDLGTPAAGDSAFVVLVAARLGSTRLIDNLQVGMDGE